MRNQALLLSGVLLLAAATPAPGQSQGDTLVEQARAHNGVRRVIHPEYPLYYSLPERFVQSDLVIRGRVVDEAARLSDDDRTIWTDYTIEILTVFKPAKGGPAVHSTVVARTEGGNLVVEGQPISVVNESFPSLPWVREHIFLFRRSSQSGVYDFLDGPKTVIRRDDEGKVRCTLPKLEWDFLCTSHDGTSWPELLDDLKKMH